jgi:hypothetical protein
MSQIRFLVTLCAAVVAAAACTTPASPPPTTSTSASTTTVQVPEPSATPPNPDEQPLAEPADKPLNEPPLADPGKPPVSDTGGRQKAPVEFISCGAPDARKQVCTKEYKPVCGMVDTGIRCIRAPCPSTAEQTFGNACSACADAKTSGYRPGACAAPGPTGPEVQ